MNKSVGRALEEVEGFFPGQKVKKNQSGKYEVEVFLSLSKI